MKYSFSAFSVFIPQNPVIYRKNPVVHTRGKTWNIFRTKIMDTSSSFYWNMMLEDSVSTKIIKSYFSSIRLTGKRQDMQLQMTTDYAMRILVDLAAQKRVVPSTELSERLVIPAKYVLQVGRKLKENQFADTVTGSKGGYVLSKPPEEISIFDILIAFEGTMKINRCLEPDEYCSRRAVTSCVVHCFFSEVQNDLEKKLKSATLATLLAKPMHITGKEIR